MRFDHVFLSLGVRNIISSVVVKNGGPSSSLLHPDGPFTCPSSRVEGEEGANAESVRFDAIRRNSVYF